jgi:hypothetical protein
MADENNTHELMHSFYFDEKKKGVYLMDVYKQNKPLRIKSREIFMKEKFTGSENGFCL